MIESMDRSSFSKAGVPAGGSKCNQARLSMKHNSSGCVSGFDRFFEHVFEGFVTPTVISDGKISGCVYRPDGSKVGLSERFGGWKGDLFPSDNPELLERPSSFVRRSGKGLYLGSLMAAHYGHFITEGLSTFWIFETHPAEEFDYFLFSPFVFGTDVPEYALQCMRAFGVDSEKIVIMGEQAMVFEDLVVPERLLRLNHTVDSSLAWVHRRIISCSNTGGDLPERVYLSRRKISFKQLTRVIANEVLVEKLFRLAGFAVIYPEDVPFKDQLALYSNAHVVAGPSGSALHNSLFMRRGSKLIELGDPRYGGERAPTQMLCDSVSGVNTAFIPFVGKILDEGKSMTVDVDFLRKSLCRVLQEGDMQASTMMDFQFETGFLERIETIYLTYRPLARTMLRKILPGA